MNLIATWRAQGEQWLARAIEEHHFLDHNYRTQVATQHTEHILQDLKPRWLSEEHELRSDGPLVSFLQSPLQRGRYEDVFKLIEARRATILTAERAALERQAEEAQPQEKPRRKRTAAEITRAETARERARQGDETARTFVAMDSGKDILMEKYARKAEILNDPDLDDDQKQELRTMLEAVTNYRLKKLTGEGDEEEKPPVIAG